MRRYFVPQQGEKLRQCGALNEVEVQKNKYVEHKPLVIACKGMVYFAVLLSHRRGLQNRWCGLELAAGLARRFIAQQPQTGKNQQTIDHQQLEIEFVAVEQNRRILV